MSVNLRKRKLRDGSEQYYFDVYHKGQREYPTYKGAQLILKPGDDKKTSKLNAEVERLANLFLEKLQAQLDEGRYDFQSKPDTLTGSSKKSESFLEYFRAEAARRHAKRGCKSNTYSCFKHFERFLKAFHGNELLFREFTTALVDDFRGYMKRLVAANTARKHGTVKDGPRGISSNCALIYMKRLKMVSAMAFREGKTPIDAAFPVKNFNYEMPKRHFLEPQEVKMLAQDLASNPVDNLMKRAFLFSCATGLRWEDLTGLTWGDVQDGMLDTEIRKSKGRKRLRFKLSAFALGFLGEEGHTSERIFPLTYNMYLNVKLDRWVLMNGIKKKITWHCARHTFATALLHNEEDISLVQVALAHSRIETTMIYSKILDTKLNDATSSIGDLFS